MRRKYSFSIGEYYHLYNRGVDKRNIFNHSSDYERFILLLYLCNSKQSVDLGNLLQVEGRSFSEIWDTDQGENIIAMGSYVLMPNHFHILVKEISENGISTFMKKLLTGYSMYFNKKNKRSGALFEGRFRAIHAHKNEYLKYLFSYIHLNPVKLINSNWKIEGIKNKEVTERYLSCYRYSSYIDYLGISRLENKLLSYQSFPKYFRRGKSFNDFTNWLILKDGPSVKTTVL